MGGLEAGATLLDAAPYDGGVALLLFGGDGRLLVRVVDATAGDLRAEVVLLEGALVAEVGLVRADEGVYVAGWYLAETSWGDVLGTLDEAVDPATGVRTPVAFGAPAAEAAVSDGVVYALDPVLGVEAYTLDGRAVEVATAPPTSEALGIYPTPEGVGIVDAGGVHTYDAATDTWTSVSSLPWLVSAWAEAGDGRVVTVSGNVRLLYDDGAWAFLGDPCGDEVDPDVWSLGDVVPLGDGRLLSFPEAGTDTDGDGIPERTITEMTLGG